MDSQNRIIVIQNSIMDINDKRIYSCMAFRIQRTSRCAEFTAVLSISYWFFYYYYIPFPKKLKGVHWFHLARLSVCPSVDRIVSAVYDPQY